MKIGITLAVVSSVFAVMAQLKPGQVVAVCGSHPAIGLWSTSRYLVIQVK